jgi:hypothetical protein
MVHEALASAAYITINSVTLLASVKLLQPNLVPYLLAGMQIHAHLKNLPIVDDALACAAYVTAVTNITPNTPCLLPLLPVTQIPEDLENVPMVDEALASAASITPLI